MILEILILYFVGKPYHTLAGIHGKSKWGYAILGCVTYYAVLFLTGFIIGLLAVMFEWEAIFEIPDILLGLILLPSGILAAWGLRLLLKKNWERKATLNSNSELLDNNQDFLDLPND